jgi:predicted nucleic acid-binding protein
VIVADANVLAYLVIPQPLTKKAELARSKEKIWAVPQVLPHELLSIVLKYVRGGKLSVDEATRAFRRGLALVEVSVIPIDAAAVLRLAEQSGCSTYDCQYVWLARDLGLPPVTEDREVLRAFPDVAVNLDHFS